MSRTSRLVFVLAFGGSLIAALIPGVHAAAAAAPCSVPSAAYPDIQAAVNDPNCDPITVAAGTFNGDVTISRSVTIRGAGSGSTTIDGLGSDSAVEIPDPTARTVTLEGLKITGGGGTCAGILAVNAAHVVTLTDVLVSGNTSPDVGGGGCMLDTPVVRITGGGFVGNTSVDAIGGLIIDGGTATITNARFDGNTTDQIGGLFLDEVNVQMTGGSVSGNVAVTIGGLFVDDGAPRLAGISIVGNRAADVVGGALLDAESLDVSGLTIDGNQAPGGDVGGALVGGSGVVRDSSITNNSTPGAAGGVFVSDAVSLTNVTVSGNRSGESGGGIHTSGPSITITNATVTGNVADSDGGTAGNGGGLFVSSGTTTVRNSIIAKNTDGSGEAPDCGGTVTSGGHNILGSNQGCTFAATTGDKVGVDPLLGPLTDNGGPTLTHALLPGSPAIDAANPAFAPPTDQRGVPRVKPDIGAYELAFCKKVVVNEIGTAGNDVISTGNEANGVLALAGNDRIRTSGGNDAICAGIGKDRANGGAGKDKLLGEAGKDRLNGGGGKDLLVGAKGKDRCIGGAGKDRARSCEVEKKL